MGPHVFACGNSVRDCTTSTDGDSFNGAARFCVRKSEPAARSPALLRASMGPHVFACGNSSGPVYGTMVTVPLQWGRTFLRAEIRRRGRQSDAIKNASMGPHVFACGNHSLRAGFVTSAAASMGPHVFACGNDNP